MIRTWARLKQHWVRHLLAALQVAIGVAVVTAIFVDVIPLIRESLPDRTTVVFSGFYGGREDGVTHMTSAFEIGDVKMLENEFETIAAASVYSTLMSSLIQVNDDRFLLRDIAQVSPGFAAIAEMEMAAGRFFLPDDVEKNGPDVAVISVGLAELIFPGEDPIGKIINLRPPSEEMRLFGYGNVELPSTEGVPGLDLMVVGVFEQPKNLSDYEGPLAGTTQAEMYIPATGHMLYNHPALRSPMDVGDLDDRLEFAATPEMNEESFTYIYFRAHDGMGEQANAEVETLLGARLAERFGNEVHFDDSHSTLVIEPAKRMDPWLLETRLQEVLVLGAFGVAALVVAGFSVFTTFLASVTERIRAIGLARALGATRWRVLREVMSEAVMLTGIGGIAGAVLAYPVRIYLLEPLDGFVVMTQTPSWIDVLIVVVAAVVVAMAIGALAALYPGWTVARLMPAEAFTEE